MGNNKPSHRSWLLAGRENWEDRKGSQKSEGRTGRFCLLASAHISAHPAVHRTSHLRHILESGLLGPLLDHLRAASSPTTVDPSRASSRALSQGHADAAIGPTIASSCPAAGDFVAASTRPSCPSCAASRFFLTGRPSSIVLCARRCRMYDHHTLSCLCSLSGALSPLLRQIGWVALLLRVCLWDDCLLTSHRRSQIFPRLMAV